MSYQETTFTKVSVRDRPAFLSKMEVRASPRKSEETSVSLHPVSRFAAAYLKNITPHSLQRRMGGLHVDRILNVENAQKT